MTVTGEVSIAPMSDIPSLRLRAIPATGLNKATGGKLDIKMNFFTTPRDTTVDARISGPRLAKPSSNASAAPMVAE